MFLSRGRMRHLIARVDRGSHGPPISLFQSSGRWFRFEGQRFVVRTVLVTARAEAFVARRAGQRAGQGGGEGQMCPEAYHWPCAGSGPAPGGEGGDGTATLKWIPCSRSQRTGSPGRWRIAGSRRDEKVAGKPTARELDSGRKISSHRSQNGTPSAHCCCCCSETLYWNPGLALPYKKLLAHACGFWETNGASLKTLWTLNPLGAGPDCSNQTVPRHTDRLGVFGVSEQNSHKGIHCGVGVHFSRSKASEPRTAQVVVPI